ncbi:FAD-dependent oxidoreductase [Sulfodiicoccus acidiphilus]|uniref:FAD-dependent oxidoreductase n=1 Tax=Sulfodiicoccus acidiphilus TaxID=1670455 RepID=A0A348B2G0_9CREN|nr:FAD-binding oxidoreductase [Sulfodiicoccus acidiphilus]BBD72362.1 FAD-dependent oxidoreductase [Sulfodiicoccus acidiphilus]GGT90033.1 FAD-dependent oxidoreductase [Sulfodiicoccus acidiphilus]
MEVVIVGAGVVGMFAAYYLEREGIDVTLIDKHGLGHGSVHAAGLIEPYRFDRMNTAEMILKMLEYARRGVTRVRRVNKEWLVQLLRNLNRNPPEEAWEVMRTMATFSLMEYARMSEEENDFNYRHQGLYEVYSDRTKMERALEEEAKSPFRNRVELVDFPPFAGALYYPGLSHLSTELFVERMRRELRNVKLILGEVSSVEGDTVKLPSREVRGDVIVLTAGLSLSTVLPLTPFKGYGYRVVGRGPGVPTVLAEEGVAIVPLEGWYKITWGFEADYEDGVRELRNNPLVRVEKVIDASCGHRPCSPDGFPILFRSANVVAATGNCRLGWSYAPAMGKYAADLVLGRTRSYPYLDRYKFLWTSYPESSLALLNTQTH